MTGKIVEKAHSAGLLKMFTYLLSLFISESTFKIIVRLFVPGFGA